MTNNDQETDRITATRQLLRDMVESEPVPRTRFRHRRSVTAGLVAFVLAGALTGGAVSAVAAVVSNQTPDTFEAHAAALGFIGTHGHLVGTPFVISGSGPTQTDLGRKPIGATGLLISLDCMTGNDISATVVHPRDVSAGECSGTSAQEIPIGDARSHTLTVTPAGTKKFAAWASWVVEPPLPGPSAQQTAELSDGNVTFSEELSAYNRYVGCLTAAGFPMGLVPTEGPYINYAVVSAAVDSGAEARCNASEFEKVDTTWQIYANDVIDTCLAAHGIAVAKDGDQDGHLQALISHKLTFEGCEANNR